MTKDISNMLEAKEDGVCPYCGQKEPPIPGYTEAMATCKDLTWVQKAKVLGKLPIEKWYEHNGTKYPYTANVQTMNDAYAHCHYGVNTWWNEIHYCSWCDKEYYTQLEH